MRSNPRRSLMFMVVCALFATACASSTEDATEQLPAPSESSAFSAVSPAVQSFVTANGLNGAGLIVVHRDRGVVHEEYWGEFGPDRISLVASSSKMVTAGVLLHLEDQGLLDMDAPIADVVGWADDHPEITAAQLVSNSSGLPGLAQGLAIPSYYCQYSAEGTLQDCAETILTTDQDDASVVAPDSEFEYGGAQWQVAGAVAEVAAGKTWAELIDEIYVEPCGLETLAFNNHFGQIGIGGFSYPAEFDNDPTTLVSTENPNMEGGMYVNTGDYAKLLMMHLEGGVCGDTQVLSAAALARMHGDRIDEVYGGDADRDNGYGYGWWVHRSSGRITDDGAYGSIPWLDLENGFGAFWVIEATSSVSQSFAPELFELVEEGILAIDGAG